jgi:hypothetical protein
MQEEVTKHTRKIYQAMKNPDHSFWGKIREVTVEILIIVFAVTLSIWLHNWSDHREEQGFKSRGKLGLIEVREFAKSFIAQAYLQVCVQTLEDGSNGTVPQDLAAEAQARRIIKEIDAYLKDR